ILFSLLCCHHLSLRTFPTRRCSDLPFTIAILLYMSSKMIRFIVLCTSMNIALNDKTIFFPKNNVINPLIEDILTHNTFFFMFCRSEEHTSELQSRFELVCRLLLQKK